MQCLLRRIALSGLLRLLSARDCGRGRFLRRRIRRIGRSLLRRGICRASGRLRVGNGGIDRFLGLGISRVGQKAARENDTEGSRQKGDPKSGLFYSS